MMVVWLLLFLQPTITTATCASHFTDTPCNNDANCEWAAGNMCVEKSEGGAGGSNVGASPSPSSSPDNSVVGGTVGISGSSPSPSSSADNSVVGGSTISSSPSPSSSGDSGDSGTSGSSSSPSSSADGGGAGSGQAAGSNVGNGAKCSSITDPGTFCANNGANGLKDSPDELPCFATPCTISMDAEGCCKPDTGTDINQDTTNGGTTSNTGNGTSSSSSSGAAGNNLLLPDTVFGAFVQGNFAPVVDDPEMMHTLIGGSDERAAISDKPWVNPVAWLLLTNDMKNAIQAGEFGKSTQKFTGCNELVWSPCKSFKEEGCDKFAYITNCENIANRDIVEVMTEYETQKKAQNLKIAQSLIDSASGSVPQKDKDNVAYWQAYNVAENAKKHGSGKLGSMNSWDMSKVTDLQDFFAYKYFFNDDISNWDVSNVRTMRRIFYRARNFNSDISKWNTKSMAPYYEKQLVTDAVDASKEYTIWAPIELGFANAFQGAWKFNHDLSGWKVENFVGTPTPPTDWEGFKIDAQHSDTNLPDSDNTAPFYNGEGPPPGENSDGTEKRYISDSGPEQKFKMFDGQVVKNNEGEDLTYDPPQYYFASRLSKNFCSKGWLDIWDGLAANDKLNYFKGTSGKVLCCNQGQRLVPATEDEGSKTGFLIPSDARCEQCPLGQYQDQDYVKPLECKTCEKGKGSFAPAKPCEACPVGQYQNEPGDSRTAAGCKNCPPGKSSLEGSETCTCPPGQYTLNATTTNCIRCEISMNCTFSGTTLENVQTNPGFWREHNTSDVFYRCKESTDCIGGHVGEQCAEKKGGALCNVCDDGHVKLGGVECSVCPSGQGRGAEGGNTVGAIVQTIVPCILLFIALIVYFVRGNRGSISDDTKVVPETEEEESVLVRAQGVLKDSATGQAEGAASAATGDTSGGEISAETEDAQAVTQGSLGTTTSLSGVTGGKGGKHARRMLILKKTLAGRLRIIIGFLQIQAALVFSFSIPWPPAFSSLIHNLSFINIDLSGIFAGMDPCTLYTPFMVSASTHMFLLPAVALIVLLAAFVATLVLRKPNTMAKAKSLFFEVSLFLYPGIATKCFTAMKCEHIGSKDYLVADFGVQCWDGEHGILFGSIILPAMIIIVIGLPLFLFIFLTLNKKKIMNGNETFENIYGNVYTAYEPKYYWFESVILLQKALLTGGLVLVAPGSSAQIFIGLLVAFAFYSIVVKTAPYEDDGEDTMQTMATATTVLTLMIGLVLKTSSETAMAAEAADGLNAGGYNDIVMDVILILLFTFVTMLSLVMTVMALPCFA